MLFSQLKCLATMGSCAASQAAGGTSKGEQWVMQGAVVSVLVTMTGNLTLPSPFS